MISHMGNLKNNANELFYKTETDSQKQNKHGYQGERGGGVN